jgi:dihydroneopterin aldolase
MSQISIEGMEFFAHHGCFKEEQIIGTKFNIDFFCEADTSEAEKKDDLNKTVNYQSIYLLIQQEMDKKSKLLEHVAHRILKKIMKTFPQIEVAEIKIAKLNPPVGGKVDRVCVALSSEEL